MQGVAQDIAAFPSIVAVAPAGPLVTKTSCGELARAGANCGRRSVLAAGPEGSAGLTASSSGRRGTACSVLACSVLAASGFDTSAPEPAAGSACPIGLGLASCGDVAGGFTGGVTSGAAGGGACSFGVAAGCPAESDGCEPGISHGAACQPSSARKPAATRMPSRKPGNPDFRFTSAVVPEAGADRLFLRGGGRIAAGAAAVAVGVFTSAIVIAFNSPPRGISFQPLLALHAFSSDSTNSWQLR